ncbi:type 1 glutamine amidotransferase domain-containing protein [Glaciecola sp. 1036]|uniref:type 1 glutamine amidotransferase domain-containing protein n=1 Tax=Alteromonadaceae TaxID=72275 RepID=UPI003CFD572D
MTTLSNKRVAILATDGFEQSELESPKKHLQASGAQVDVISLESGTIKGWDGDNWGSDVKVDIRLQHANADNYDALVLPGGLINPDTLRTNDKAIAFVKAFFKDNSKPVAAICHGPWLLAEAGVIESKQITSFPSIRTDVENAGAFWKDKEVVQDGQIITSRNPGDLDAFNSTIAKALAA